MADNLELKLLPREPTDEMLRAVCDSHDPDAATNSGKRGCSRQVAAASRWRAMFDAAPEARTPTPPAGDVEREIRDILSEHLPHGTDFNSAVPVLSALAAGGGERMREALERIRSAHLHSTSDTDGMNRIEQVLDECAPFLNEQEG